jgi:hypothetical protein
MRPIGSKALVRCIYRRHSNGKSHARRKYGHGNRSFLRRDAPAIRVRVWNVGTIWQRRCSRRLSRELYTRRGSTSEGVVIPCDIMRSSD